MKVFTIVNAETKELVACISENDSIVQKGFEVIVSDENEVRFKDNDNRLYLANEVK